MNSGNSTPERRSATPGIVQQVVGDFLDLVDREVPGRVEGLYLVGSVALSDFRPHESDIDFVAVMETRPDAATVEILSSVHAHVQSRYARPYFDGVYVTWEDLRREPALSAPVPSAHEGKVQMGDFEPNPVTWHTLARRGVAVRGPSAAELEIWADPTVLASWTRGNLQSYWEPWREQTAQLFSGQPERITSYGEWASAWGGLGVTRLHYTLRTGEITSKEGAGLYALETFPGKWHRVVNECLRIRRGERVPSL